MRGIFGLAAIAAAGVIIGAVGAWTIIGSVLPGMRSMTVDASGWQTDLAVGSSAADPLTRGRVARIGLLALNRSEAVYLQRYSDDEGRPFREACVYRISGAGLPARWWSITLYAADNYLAQNDDDANSINLSGISANGEWRAMIARDRPASGAWLSSASAGDFSLTLRLYHPAAAALKALGEIDLPRVERISCGGERR